MKIFSSLLACGVLISVKLAAQDPTLINSNQSLVFLNPSFAGSNEGVRNQLSYRHEGVSYGGNETMLNTFDAFIKPLNAGVALSMMVDNAGGVMKTSNFGLTYAQHLSLLDGKLKVVPSIQFGYGKKMLDVNALNFGDPMDPRNGFVWTNFTSLPSTRKSYFELNTGFLLNLKRDLFVGAYLFHANRPNVGMDGSARLEERWLLHASYTSHFSKATMLQFVGRYDYQRFFRNLQLGANLLFCKYFIAGLGYLTASSSPSFNLGIRNNFFRLQAGYDLTLSKLAGNTAGAWELHASFNLRNKELRHELTNFENW